ncbi:hypothetical protein Ae201684P_019753 [Aphanomyces euteiches]|nr:hypothetical protein Ae201684P_019753 [Aphanomyces euteiches]
MKTYERSNVACTGQTEGGKDTAVFWVENGGTLKNVIIGKNQVEGVHCEDHGCTIENVWWDDVCEDALSIKVPTTRSSNTTLYRSCGSCKTQYQRKVTVTNVYAVNPKVTLVGVNKNYNDQAKFSNIKIKSSKTPNVCTYFQGGTSGEPKQLGSGILSPTCQYVASDIHSSEHIHSKESRAGQAEGGKDTADFLVEPGATLKNVIIGKKQAEEIHCESHDCTIQNVWWDDVCEDALSIKGGSASNVAKVIGGGARNAEDKIIQHNGAGTVSIEGFNA